MRRKYGLLIRTQKDPHSTVQKLLPLTLNVSYCLMKFVVNKTYTLKSITPFEWETDGTTSSLTAIYGEDTDIRICLDGNTPDVLLGKYPDLCERIQNAGSNSYFFPTDFPEPLEINLEHLLLTCTGSSQITDDLGTFTEVQFSIS